MAQPSLATVVAASAALSLASLQGAEPPLARPAKTDLRLVWTSSETNGTYVIAWGDYDGDGDPDLACGNKWRTGHNQLYRNDRGNLVLVWTAPIEDATESDGLAWGDFDGDGDLDLAVANAGPQPNRVWRNDDGKLVEAWVSAEHDWCFAVRWADLDGDGDLDLAVGSREQELSRVYRNNQGRLEPALSFAESSRSEGLDWADMDGDGDPDLALANYRKQPNLVFENRDGTLVQAWSSPELDNSLSAAWGDWDGDQDLDLAIANEHEPNRVYENREGELVLAWSSKEADASRCVAWGDWDGDGDLDLAVGSEGDPNRVYENTGGGLILAWSSFEADHTVCVAWADVNGDGFLDLACGNKGPNRLYLNSAPGRVAALPMTKWRAANALEGVKWQGRYVNHLGAIKTCLDYLGVEISRGWLFGGTAHAFAINLRETVCVSSPTAWNTQMLFDLAPNLGYQVEGIKMPKANAGEAFRMKQREAWDLVRTSIDSGFPCYGFELQHPDYYVVYGYEDGHYLFDGWAKGRLPWQKLGAYDLCVLEIYAVKPCKPAPADKVVKDALAAAIKHAENPGHWVLPRYQSGPTAFDLWADELESGRAIHDSHCYNAAFWHECREAAVEFLIEAKRRLPGRCDGAFEEAIADYKIVRDNLKQLIELHPERKNRNWQDRLKSPEGAALLREAGAAECEGLSDLERILAALGAEAPKETPAKGARSMESTLQTIETERLILRAFTPKDWPGIQELAKDFAASDAAVYDHAWPTSEEGCKGAADYFVNRKGLSWAVCLKPDQRLIGYISFNGVDENKRLDLGHLFHSEFYRDDYDTEALGRLVEHAFTHQDIESVHGDNALDWTVQLASLKKLGFKLLPPPPGPVRKASFHKDEHGNPIEFVGCRMEITKEEWLRQSRKETPVKVKTDGTKVYLAGLDPMDWGKGEMCEFAAALTRTLSCVGEEVPYHYVMGVTGVAFRFTFGPEHWNPGFYGFEGVGPDVNDLIRRAFEAVGYGYVYHTQGDAAEDRLRITDSVDRGIAVMLRGHLVDASDWALVGGYDRDNANLLFASSPYGRKDKPLPGLDAAPDWHGKTKYYLILGAKRERPAVETIYTDALRLAVTLVRSPKLGNHYAGLKALEVLADTLRTDEFPEETERKEEKPFFRYLCILCYNMMLDDHKSAAPFLRDAAKVLPKCSAELTEAAACYERAGEVRDQLETILKSNFSQEAQKSVLDPKVRNDFAAALLKIRDIEAEGIAHIERALEK